MFHFQNIENLFVLGAIPFMMVLFFLVLQWKKKAVKKIGDKHLVKQLTATFSPGRFTLKFILIIAAFLMGALAIAGLVKPEGPQLVNRKGIDVMIALDVSNSMLAEDIKPNRLERAKQLVFRLIDKLADNRIGLVIFAGRAYVQMPMTTDHSAAKMYLSAISPDDVPTQGTVIGEALKVCYAAFNTTEKKYRSIILLTDGEDHDEDAVKIARQLAEEGVMINTIGIGSPEGALIPDKETNEPRKDENNNPVVSKLNEVVLKDIAQNANGLYQLFTTTDAVVSNLRKTLSGLGQTTLTDTAFAIKTHYFVYFLWGALILLLIEFFITEKKKLVVQNVAKPFGATIVLALLSHALLAQAVNNKIVKDLTEGNKAYNKNQFDTASSIYQKALQKAPGNKIAYYNLGNASYKSGRAEDAVKSFDAVVDASAEKEFREKAYYNKGVVFQSQNKLPECIEAYKQALKLDPGDEEARQNLQRAILQLKQQQKQPEEQKDKRQDNRNEKKKSKQKDEQEQQPRPSKITKTDAEEKLKSLMEHEKNLQEKLRKVKTGTPEQSAKDW